MGITGITDAPAYAAWENRAVQYCHSLVLVLRSDHPRFQCLLPSRCQHTPYCRHKLSFSCFTLQKILFPWRSRHRYFDRSRARKRYYTLERERNVIAFRESIFAGSNNHIPRLISNRPGMLVVMEVKRY